MKVQLFAVLLLLITNSLVAQSGFSIKLTQDETGLFTVTAKSNTKITRPVLGSAQVMLVVPKDGLVVSDLVFHTAEWKHEIINTNLYLLEADYASFYLQPGESFFLDAITADEEFKLFSFRNTAACIGPIRFIDPNFTPTESLPLNLGMDMGVIDLITNNVHSFVGNYGATEIPCISEPDISVPDTSVPDIIVLDTMLFHPEIEWINNQSTIITWNPIEGISNFQLEVRAKGDAEWDNAEVLKLTTNKAYFYGVPNQLYEYRLRTNYENGAYEVSTIYPLGQSTTSGE